MRIVVDTREKPRAIVRIMKTFDREGVEVVRRALPFGDYLNPERPGIVIDRKQNLLEVASNLVQDRARFLREVDRANRAGARLIILVEHSNRIQRLEDVVHWNNPRLKVSPLAVDGPRLFRIMHAMGNKYGFEWAFCDKIHTGRRIIELLESDRYD
jgi:ERCC4-type nuclease